MLRRPGAALEYGPAAWAAPQHGRILQRIAVQDEQVGARADPAQVVTPEQFRVDRGSRPEQRQRSLDPGLQPQPVENRSISWTSSRVGPNLSPG